MSIIWCKVWRDLVHNKTRTALVVLSTAVGVFALGLVFGTSDLTRARMTADHQSTSPAHLTLWTSPFDATLVEAVRREPSVADVEAETQASIRWKLAGEADWRSGSLIARADYATQRLNRTDLLAGIWPAKETLALERQTARFFGLAPGAVILVEVGQRGRPVTLTGIVRSATTFPPQFGGDPTFYATPETVAWVTGQEGFNQLDIRLAAFSPAKAKTALDQIESRLDRMSITVGGYQITDPQVHWMQTRVDALFLILGGLGILVLGLAAFLIVNTLNAILAREVRQIGVMKAVGATAPRILQVYLATVLAYGGLALLVAVPLGALGTYWLAGTLLDFLNITAGPFRLLPQTVGLQSGVGLAVPVLAALVPVIGGARLSPHQAMSQYGLTGQLGAGRLDRWVGRVRRLPTPLAISVRNTFRNKGRVALTLAALTLGGLIFIAVMSVSDSLNNTLEVLLGDFGSEIWVEWNQPQRTAWLLQLARSVPGVAQAEVWHHQDAKVRLPDGTETQIGLWGLPPDSALFRPRLLSGRWLVPGDNYAIVLNSKLASDQGFHPGDKIEMTLLGHKAVWTVVGVDLNLNNGQRDSFVPSDTLGREIGAVNRGTEVLVQMTQPAAQSQPALGQALRAAYTAAGLVPDYLSTADESRARNRSQFSILVYLLLAMAVLAGVVGGIGLMGAMSIAVTERYREIGVMRAIGASSGAVAMVFIGEGLLVGLASWALAAVFSVPVGWLFSQAVGRVMFPLEYRYSTTGLGAWLVLAVVLSALSSAWPAWRATHLSVRESLAYE